MVIVMSRIDVLEKARSRYKPQISSSKWALIENFVTAAVLDAEGRTPYKHNELMLAVSRLVLWATETAGLPQDRSILFRREVIGRFISVGCPGQKPAARGTLRSQLLRVAEALLDPKLAPARLKPLPPADASRPYSAQDLLVLRSWAASQPTAGRRGSAEVLLALGAGAGLSAQEVARLLVADIEVDELGVLVHIREERTRTVPVLIEWETALRDRVEQLAPDKFAFRPGRQSSYVNVITHFVDRGHLPQIPVQSQRLRATWLVRQMNAGTPVGMLMKAAGVESLEALTRYVKFVEHMDTALARLALSNPDVHVTSVKGGSAG